MYYFSVISLLAYPWTVWERRRQNIANISWMTTIQYLLHSTIIWHGILSSLWSIFHWIQSFAVLLKVEFSPVQPDTSCLCTSLRAFCNVLHNYCFLIFFLLLICSVDSEREVKNIGTSFYSHFTLEMLHYSRAFWLSSSLLAKPGDLMLLITREGLSPWSLRRIKV